MSCEQVESELEDEYDDMPALMPISDDEDDDDDGDNEGNEGDDDDDDDEGSESSSDEEETQTRSRIQTPSISRTSSLARAPVLSRVPSLQQTPASTQQAIDPLPSVAEDDMDVDQIDQPPGEESSSSSSSSSSSAGTEREGPAGYTEDQGAPTKPSRKEFIDGEGFINPLLSASLDASGLAPEVLARLRSPVPTVRELTPVERAAIRMYVARGDASEENYADNRAAFMELHPEDPLPSYDQVKRLVANMTGVSALRTDMCADTCVAFTGPFEKDLLCPKCGKTRYDPVELARGRQVPRRTFVTFPLGPQLQAMWASPENARLMKHRRRETERIQAQLAAAGGNIEALEDIYYGQDYLEHAENSRDTPEERQKWEIGPDDMMLMFSIDGAQLYAMKGSDTWFYIWILFDLPPTCRYKKRYILPGGVIGGPNKPKSVDSFLFPGLYHLAALQREGLAIWDADEERLFRSYLYLFLVTADSPAMAYLNGLVGHTGAHCCRLYCGQCGRHKPGIGIYYPALTSYGSDDDGPPNISLRVDQDATIRPQLYKEKLAIVRAARRKVDYERARLATGIAKPSIFSGLPPTRFLGVPGGFVLDRMHLITLNMTDLIILLLRGTMDVEAPDNKATWDFAIFAKKNPWKAHGKLVADCARYLPGSFDRPPRNPAEKIRSGYKAWEFLLYVYGLLPGLLRGILPEKYYRHFCYLVAGVRIVLQTRLPLQQLPLAHRSFVLYAEGFEQLYYQSRVERLHFVRPCLHTLTHIVPEASRIGPGALHSQWTMENFIGSITREIKQHVTPYANVSERAFRRCQVNSLKAIDPSFAIAEPGVPSTGIDLEDGYALLRAADGVERDVTRAESAAIHAFLRDNNVPLDNPDWIAIVCRWARVSIPTGQVGRSAWKEEIREARGKAPRRARMVKVSMIPSLRRLPLADVNFMVQLRGDRFAEVRYYFQFRYFGGDHTLAMITPFTAPDPDILTYSRNTVLACTYRGDDVREVVPVKDIISIVAMVPLPMTPAEAQQPDAATRYADRYFVVEKPGLDIAHMAGRDDNPNVDPDEFHVD